MSIPSIHTNETLVFRPGIAENLADLYLPVHLRDFYLQSHPLVQVSLYRLSSSPEEFFTLVQQEQSRRQHLNSTKGKWYERDSRNNVKEPIYQIIPSLPTNPTPLLTDRRP